MLHTKIGLNQSNLLWVKRRLLFSTEVNSSTSNIRQGLKYWKELHAYLQTVEEIGNVFSEWNTLAYLHISGKVENLWQNETH